MARRFGRRRFGVLATAACASPAAAAVLPQPQGRPILVVSGAINNTNAATPAGAVARFDRDMLEAVGMTGFETSTPWYDGPVRFDGVPMARLLREVGAANAAGATVTALALNDYSTDIPVSDFERYGVILALKRNGAYMPVRDKGPLFIVYPFDAHPELRTQLYYSRCAWQVAELIVS